MRRAFVFAARGRHGSRTHAPAVRRRNSSGTLRRSLDAYVRRGDFSRWIEEVFGDYALAVQVRAIEERDRTAPTPETVAEIANVIRARYAVT